MILRKNKQTVHLIPYRKFSFNLMCYCLGAILSNVRLNRFTRTGNLLFR